MDGATYAIAQHLGLSFAGIELIAAKNDQPSDNVFPLLPLVEDAPTDLRLTDRDDRHWYRRLRGKENDCC